VPKNNVLLKYTFVKTMKNVKYLDLNMIKRIELFFPERKIPLKIE